jgi:F-box protein, helicase, 18
MATAKPTFVLPIPRELIESLTQRPPVEIGWLSIGYSLLNDAWSALFTVARLGIERTNLPDERMSKREIVEEFHRLRQVCEQDPLGSRYELLAKTTCLDDYLKKGLAMVDRAGVTFSALQNYWTQPQSASSPTAQTTPSTSLAPLDRAPHYDTGTAEGHNGAFTHATCVRPTEEQQALIDAAVAARGDAVLKAQALAGSGKTTLCAFLGEEVRRPRKIYLAFNKVMAEQATHRLGSLMECRTMDSLAYRVVRPSKIWGEERVKAGYRPEWSSIADALGLPASFGAFKRGPLARLVYQIVLNFCYSRDRELSLEHVPLPLRSVGADQLLLWAISLWDRMLATDQRLPVPPPQVLKWWQLSGGTLDYDVVLFDEAQDACPAFTEILRASSGLLLPIGDPHQQLYGWRGATDIMSLLPGDPYALTRCFRFGVAIESVTNRVLKAKSQAPAHLIVGNSGIDSKVRVYEGPATYPQWPVTILARTNAQVFRRAVDIAKQGHRLHVVGDIDDLRWLLLDALRLFRREPGAVTHWRLRCFPDWNALLAEAEAHDPELRRIQEIIETRHLVLERELEELKKHHEPDPLRAPAILSTTHKVKGREWDRVMLLDDFVRPEDLSALDEAERDAELNILYVAVTRARRELYVPRSLAPLCIGRT